MMNACAPFFIFIKRKSNLKWSSVNVRLLNERVAKTIYSLG